MKVPNVKQFFKNLKPFKVIFKNQEIPVYECEGMAEIFYELIVECDYDDIK